jgi:hypothetical protein
VRPSDIYLNIQFHGTYKSNDYGLSWTKVSTGTNADKIASGYATYAAIDRNPCRDPGTAPAMYFIQLFGSGGILKSVDGGVSWTNIWNNNLFAPDGVTNISSDVGGDVHSIHVVDPRESNHLIATLHGYFGTGGNNGVFESTDGGAKWIVRKTQLFTFQPHNNIIFPLDSKTWLVTPGTISDNMHAYRTTDGAASWDDLGAVPMRGLGRHVVQAGSTAYAGTDYNDTAYKSIDMGKTWTKLTGAGGQVSWVVATRTKLYTSGGYTTPPALRHADIDHDTTWITDGTPQGMNDNGTHATVTFDGTHYVIIASQHKSGIWRYIEP